MMIEQFDIEALRASVEGYIGKPLDTVFADMSDLAIECADALAPHDPIAQARLHVLRAARGLEAPEPSCSGSPEYVAEHREVSRCAETYCDDVHLILVLDLLGRLEELSEPR